MPQLLPHFFVNQITWAILGLGATIFVVSVYLLPYIIQLFVTRVYITKL